MPSASEMHHNNSDLPMPDACASDVRRALQAQTTLTKKNARAMCMYFQLIVLSSFHLFIFIVSEYEVIQVHGISYI